jgi:membrane protein implicated in regulation of membrane protease activity
VIWSDWWLWGAAALVLGCLEMLLPGFILLGFAIGAGVVALLLLVGGPVAVGLSGSLPLTLVVFAVLSLLGWMALRRFVGVRDGQVKTFDHDVND